MIEGDPFCFVIMPFAPELNYFFLYVSQHIKDKYGITCIRADSRISSEPFLQRIIQYIRESEIVIADCSGRNPNVFYELGIAHAFGKKVVLLTSDDADKIPSDLKHYGFIIYNLEDHVGFLSKLDSALSDLLTTRYDELYDRALLLYDSFKMETPLHLEVVPRNRFLDSVRAADRLGELPVADVRALQDADIAPFLLPKIIVNSRDPTIMREISSWISRQSD